MQCDKFSCIVQLDLWRMLDCPPKLSLPKLAEQAWPRSITIQKSGEAVVVVGDFRECKLIQPPNDT